MDLEAAVAPVLRAVAPRALALYLWGSHARGEAHERSDVDVCVVGGPGADLDAVYRSVLQGLSTTTSELDVKLFEDLPLYLKGEILDEGRVLWTRDPQALDEYLWMTRKLWRDARRRHVVDPEDVKRALAG